MTETGGAQTFESLTAKELLAGYVGTLNELLRRGLIRTRNAPLGDLMEYVANVAYDGALAANSAKSHDLTAADGRLIQVKARAIVPGGRMQAFSAVRSFDFDALVFVVIDALTYQLSWAREVGVEETRSLGSYVGHTNSTAIRVSKVRNAGIDVTAKMREAFEGLA